MFSPSELRLDSRWENGGFLQRVRTSDQELTRVTKVGTHIEGLFPHDVEFSKAAVLAVLDTAFQRLGPDLELIHRLGWFPGHAGEWWLNDEEPDTAGIYGEGPFGFDINVYDRYVHLRSMERFLAIKSSKVGINTPLQRVFAAVADGFGARGRLAVVEGGRGDLGDGDTVLEERGFEAMCDYLSVRLRPPARTWAAFENSDAQWYMSRVDPAT